MKQLFIYLSGFLLTVLILSGCSKLKEDITTPEEVNIHPEGFAKPAHHNFHGFYIRDLNWDMAQCKQCHGTNYNGGLVNVSCLTCHTQPAGPENCAACHGSNLSPAPPTDLAGNSSITERGVGAHQVHLTANSSAKTVSCSECHVVPGSVYQAGHVDSNLPAEVTMEGYLAKIITNEPTDSRYTTDLPTFTPNPEYNPADQSCSNTYCHGTFKNGNAGNKPTWTDPASARCGTCHGDPSKATLAERALPGGTHLPGEAILNCSTCHDGVVNENLQFINPSKHIDGKVNLFGKDEDF